MVIAHESDVSLDKADAAAAVEMVAVEAQAVEGLAADQFGHGVGELDFPARAGFKGGQVVEHFGLEDIAPDDGEGRGGVFGFWFFNQAFNGDVFPIV